MLTLELIADTAIAIQRHGISATIDFVNRQPKLTSLLIILPGLINTHAFFARMEYTLTEEEDGRVFLTRKDC